MAEDGKISNRQAKISVTREITRRRRMTGIASTPCMPKMTAIKWLRALVIGSREGNAVGNIIAQSGPSLGPEARRRAEAARQAAAACRNLT